MAFHRKSTLVENYLSFDSQDLRFSRYSYSFAHCTLTLTVNATLYKVTLLRNKDLL